MTRFINLLEQSLKQGTFIRCIWSNPRKSDGAQKLTAKGLTLNDHYKVQFALLQDKKEFHHNKDLEEVATFVLEKGQGFKQIQLYTSEADYTFLINKKGQATIKKGPATQQLPASLSHNRQKNYLLDTPSSAPFLKALGLMDQGGQIKPSKYDKYKQINRYLEIVADTLTSLPEGPLRIVDFGCGKSYLTFALYHYLHILLGKEVEVIGLDLKADVIAFCQKLAQDLGFIGLKFQVGDIGQYTTDQTIDMVVSLHACNTATDSALAKAIGWKAKVILAVPCCHHEAYTQLQNKLLEPILKYGLLKERIAALLTDGIRSTLLETLGYTVSVLEFIDMAHTPKNILIRATLPLDSSLIQDQMSLANYNTLCHALHLKPSLGEMLNLHETPKN
ncbi:SAM-dependent methyltransferase [Sporanaerobium hydrogeniformans]|uniref:SAM-dependent methyltransferase n=1 Tax=Sporanaerobium hydrogeniformans TaxID=3072179 RepID=A0AC61DE77_9FIRM|nr:SAM-dependent methyltransferase [Sporanaerobium hydrogeniformans]PHV71170.1 SAM-dependent methyltransferase [Sporanaerobium hydrogeniformans]